MTIRIYMFGYINWVSMNIFKFLNYRGILNCRNLNRLYYLYNSKTWKCSYLSNTKTKSIQPERVSSTLYTCPSNFPQCGIYLPQVKRSHAHPPSAAGLTVCCPTPISASTCAVCHNVLKEFVYVLWKYNQQFGKR